MSDDMSGRLEESTARYVRLQIEMVVELTGSGELTSAALERIGADEYMPEDERAHAREAVRRDEAEALAYLVDPFGLFGDVPGVELVQASWSSAHAEYDPDEEEWEVYEGELPEEERGAGKSGE